ncbi:MAG: Peptidase protein, partial [Chloroflexota bacterium]|nr:Peptidase protein [Chloroflexota bacterium]
MSGRHGPGRGPWRVVVAEGSMRPAVEPGDWLLVDPTVARWPRRGTVVVFREPGSDELALKRVAARPGDWVPFADAWLQLGPDE